MKKISPSILSCDFANMQEDIKTISDCVEYLHIDVMDGVFVIIISFGIPVIKALRRHFTNVFDTHLMIIDPLRYIDAFATAGADIITFHIESDSNPVEVIEKIHSLGLKAGISLNPETEIKHIEKYLSMVELVLVMSVTPGFGGQKFNPNALEKIKYLSNVREQYGYHYEIEVDGGINNETAILCKEAGVDVLVSGSYIFNANNRQEIIEKLRA